jgi:hypothetical protein
MVNGNFPVSFYTIVHTMSLVFVLFTAIPAKNDKLIIHHVDSTFTCSLTINCMLSQQQAFDFLCMDSIIKRLPGSADSVAVDTTSLGKVRVISFFKMFGYRAKSTILRTAFRQRGEIFLDVYDFEHNWSIVPLVLSGSGLYAIQPTVNGSTITYTQRVNLDRLIKPLHKFLIFWQLSAFERQFKHVFEPFQNN